MRSTWASVLILLLWATGVVAADPTPGPSEEQRAKELADQLSSIDETTVNQAVDQIHALFESDPAQSVMFYRKYWLPSLVSADQFELAERLAFDGVLAAPWQTGSIEFLEETRVHMLLRRNQPEKALSAARSLFNVASLRGTEHALSLVTQCLKAVHGEDNAMIRRFRKEELAGATTRPATQPEPISQTMAEISIDPSPYAAAISQLVSDDDQTRASKGNLLLLAGRSEEAKTIFEAMDRSSDSADRTSLAENVARAIKASDGTIGQANGYMLSAALAAKPE